MQHKQRIISSTTDKQEIKLAQPNYQYEKRQKELAKKKKKEDKLREKAQKTEIPAADTTADVITENDSSNPK